MILFHHIKRNLEIYEFEALKPTIETINYFIHQQYKF
jgi:hypothetical protein